MLALKSTENMTGVLISGDFWDLDELCSAIHHLTGKEDRYMDWQGARMRLLGVTSEIRYAYQGNRNIDFVANGLHKEMMKSHDFIAPENNIYYSTEILWPELVFSFIALNDFIQLYKKYEFANDFDLHIVNVRKFQALISEAWKDILTNEEYAVILSAVYSPETTVEEYAIQYIDMLNLSYIEMTKEQRTKSFSSIVQNIVMGNGEYEAIKKKVIAEASKTKSAIHDLRFNVNYPEQIDW